MNMRGRQCVARRIARVAGLAVIMAARESAGFPAFTSAVALQPPAGGSSVYVEYYHPLSAASGTVGYSFFGILGSRGVRWAPDGTPTVLGDLPIQPGQMRPPSSKAFGVSDSGAAVGSASRPDYANLRGAVRWAPDGSASWLGEVPGQTTTASEAWAVNDAGQVAGFTNLVGGSLAGYHAVRWEADGSPTLLGPIPGQTANATSEAYAINRAGQTAGYVFSGAVERAVRWESDGSAVVLGTVAGLTTTGSDAYAINDVGMVAGRASVAGLGYRAMRWDVNGLATRLGDVPGQTMISSIAHGITDGGIAVGEASWVPFIGRAVLWDAAGNAALLQDLVADGNTWTFGLAYDIDADADRIRVVARGSKNGGPDAWYMLNAAVPEPALPGLVGVTGTRLLGRRLRRSRAWISRSPR